MRTSANDAYPLGSTGLAGAEYSLALYGSPVSRHRAIAQDRMRRARLIFAAALRELKHGALHFAPMHWQDYYRAKQEHLHCLRLSQSIQPARKLNYVYQ